jgi:hypothetical protein
MRIVCAPVRKPLSKQPRSEAGFIVNKNLIHSYVVKYRNTINGTLEGAVVHFCDLVITALAAVLRLQDLVVRGITIHAIVGNLPAPHTISNFSSSVVTNM